MEITSGMVVKAQRGDASAREAFASWLLAHVSMMVYGCHMGRPEDRQDLVSCGVVAALNALSAYDPKRAVPPGSYFVNAVARRAVINELRIQVQWNRWHEVLADVLDNGRCRFTSCYASDEFMQLAARLTQSVVKQWGKDSPEVRLLEARLQGLTWARTAERVGLCVPVLMARWEKWLIWFRRHQYSIFPEWRYEVGTLRTRLQ